MAKLPQKKQNKVYINKYLVNVIKKNGTRFFDTFNEILDRQLGYVNNKFKKLPQKLTTDTEFTCKGCGDKCCNQKKSNIACEVFPTDLKRWLGENLGVLLVSTGTAVTTGDTKEAFLFIDRKEDFQRKQRFRTREYIDNVVKINPSLALVSENEKQQCLFFNCLSGQCSIYEYRPISCRCFPYGVSPDCKVVVEKSLCGEDCFKPGMPKNWKTQEDDLKITWANIHGMQLFIRARISGSIAYQDGKYAGNRAKVEKFKRNVAVNAVGMMYQNFITTLYLLYPELTNVEELTKEMSKKQ